jgi:hypothetical protein
LSWALFHLDGRLLEAGEKSVFLGYGQSHRQKTLDLSRKLKTHGARNIVLRIRLETERGAVSEDTVFLTAPRFIAFPRVPISITVERTTQREFQLGFHSRGFHHAVQIDLPGIAHKFEDNFFDLYPGEMRKVRARTEKAAMLVRLSARSRFDHWPTSDASRGSNPFDALAPIRCRESPDTIFLFLHLRNLEWEALDLRKVSCERLLSAGHHQDPVRSEANPGGLRSASHRVGRLARQAESRLHTHCSRG